MYRWVFVLAAVTFSLSVNAASTVDIFEFETAEQETRYRALIAEIRCPKCMNTNIAGSDALSAQTLRAAVHRMIVQEGKTDEEVLAFMQERYGDFVLYDPPLTSRTWLVWLLPIIVALLIAFMLIRIVLRARAAETPEVNLEGLDDETRARLQGLTGSEGSAQKS